MHKIEIDNELFAFLQKRALAFVETPNDALKRLLGVQQGKQGEASEDPVRILSIARKRPKANLGELIKAGVLRNGQILYLHDYQGNRIAHAEASIAGHGIYWAENKRVYSMSDLACELLKKEGFQSESVRGPAHWYTSDGVSVMTLWENHLQKAG